VFNKRSSTIKLVYLPYEKEERKKVQVLLAPLRWSAYQKVDLWSNRSCNENK
jgi:hypothetical protein